MEMSEDRFHFFFFLLNFSLLVWSFAVGFCYEIEAHLEFIVLLAQSRRCWNDCLNHLHPLGWNLIWFLKGREFDIQMYWEGLLRQEWRQVVCLTTLEWDGMLRDGWWVESGWKRWWPSWWSASYGLPSVWCGSLSLVLAVVTSYCSCPWLWRMTTIVAGCFRNCVGEDGSFPERLAEASTQSSEGSSTSVALAYWVEILEREPSFLYSLQLMPNSWMLPSPQE